MDKHIFNTTEAPVVTLKVHGDLVVKGIDEPQVIFKASPEGLVVEHEEQRVFLEIPDSAAIKVPYQAEVRIGQQTATLSGFRRHALIDDVGDLTQVRWECRIGTINGNLIAEA
jgi:hypothetical protein